MINRAPRRIAMSEKQLDRAIAHGEEIYMKKGGARCRVSGTSAEISAAANAVRRQD